MKIKRIGILTGGGDCPGLNAAIRAVTKTALKEYHLEVFGIEDSFSGLMDGRVRPLGWNDVSNIIQSGGTILGSNNQWNPLAVPVIKDGQRFYEDRTDEVINEIHKLNLDALFVIGGDGTIQIARALAQKGIFCVCIPKTIDNDVPFCERSVGFDTAVNIATEALDRVHTSAMSHHRVMIVEVMGRHAGWIALHAGLASGSDVILIPEIPYDPDLVATYVLERSKKGKRFSLICISEGAYAIGKRPVYTKVYEDYQRLEGVSLHLAQELRDRTGLETRATILGHIQRGGTPSAADRVLATVYGSLAVHTVMDPHFQQMGKAKGLFITYYKGKYRVRPLIPWSRHNRRVKEDNELIGTARGVGICLGDRLTKIGSQRPR